MKTTTKVTIFDGDWKMEVAQGLFAELEVFDRDIALLDADLEVLSLEPLDPDTQVARQDPCHRSLQHALLLQMPRSVCALRGQTFRVGCRNGARLFA